MISKPSTTGRSQTGSSNSPERQTRSIGRRSGGSHGAFSREERRLEFEHKILKIRRVARVVAGGRRFAFSVALAIGNRRGQVGVGTGKASDTTLAIEKALNRARKRLILVARTDKGTIPHEVSAKYSASRIVIQPAPGAGLVAGSSVRAVLELAGVSDVSAKIYSRSKNKLNNAQVALKALAQLSIDPKTRDRLGSNQPPEPAAS